jgi:Domain of unknown function (DUF6434)
VRASGYREDKLKTFDWHGDPITSETPITTAYRNTQNVRRFFKAECGDHFKFDRAFMAEGRKEQDHGRCRQAVASVRSEIDRGVDIPLAFATRHRASPPRAR